MAGTYLEGTSKILSGVYTLIRAAIEYVALGARGTVAYPFTSNWGPINQLKTVLYGDEFNKLYNAKGTTLTASKITAHAWKGKPQRVLAWRMAVATAAKKGVCVLKAADDQMSLTLETLYESDRAFVAAVKDSLNYPGGKMIELTEGSRLLARFDAPNLEGLAVKIDYSDYLRVKEKGASLPANSAGTIFTGGNNGNSVTVDDYSAFMTVIEADGKANAFTFDAVTDEAILATAEEFTKRVRAEGFYVTWVRGGPVAWDTNRDAADQASINCNNRGIVNVGNGCDGYTAAEMAIFIAARVASIALNRTLTDEVVDYNDVNKQPTPGERVVAKENGTLLFMREGTAVIIDEGVNTLVNPMTDEVKEMGKIRINNALDQISHDLEVFGNEYKKTRSNTEAARETYASTVEDTYLKALVALEVVQPGYFYRPDPQYHGKDAVFHPKPDEAFFYADLTPVDSMERIYQKITLHF